MERLQKLLAKAGIASRRAAEELIVTGKVRVNGKIVRSLGSKASEQDRIEVSGRRIVFDKPEYWILHKPRQVVSTLDDPQDRTCISDLTKRIHARIYPIGRLDYHTSGVLVLTNDGEMAHALLHPSAKVAKEYIAKVKGHPSEQCLQQLTNGVRLDDGYLTKPAQVQKLRVTQSASFIRIILSEGKNRQVIRMFDAVGHRVLRLSRTRFAGLDCEDLQPGQLRKLKAKEIERLKKAYVLPMRQRTKNSDTIHEDFLEPFNELP